MIVLGSCKRLFGVDAKKVGWGKCYVETEDWDYGERMEYRHCLWRGSVCTERKHLVRKEFTRVMDVEVDRSFGTQKE